MKLTNDNYFIPEAAEEYNGETLGMYIGGTIGTLMMVSMILVGGM